MTAKAVPGGALGDSRQRATMGQEMSVTSQRAPGNLSLRERVRKPVPQPISRTRGRGGRAEHAIFPARRPAIRR